MMKSKEICPICGKKNNIEFKPFCSNRCKDVDLAKWFRGDYALPVTPEDKALEDFGDDE